MRGGCSGITQFGVAKDSRFGLLGNSAVEVIIRCRAKTIRALNIVASQTASFCGCKSTVVGSFLPRHPSS